MLLRPLLYLARFSVGTYFLCFDPAKAYIYRSFFVTSLLNNWKII